MGEECAGGVVLTEKAASKIRELLLDAPNQNLALRVSAEPGGCCGPHYQLSLDDRQLADDLASEYFGVRVLTDPGSASLVAGATIDFVETSAQQGFTIDNPGLSGCGSCGGDCQ